MTFTTLLLFLFLASPAIYLITRISKISGYVLIAVEQLFMFGYILFQKGSETVFNGPVVFGDLGLNFSINPMTWFFGTIVAFIVSLTAVFMISSDKKSPLKAFLFNVISVGAIGAFFAADFFTLLVFIELVTWPTLIMMIQDYKHSWKEALKYVSIGAIGSYSLMYTVFLLYKEYGTLDYMKVSTALFDSPASFQITVFVLLGLTSIAKSGAFPLHIWRRGAYSKAPDEFTPTFAGVLSKVGDYVFFITVLVLPTFRLFSWAPFFREIPLPNYIMAVIGGASIIIGTVLAIRMDDAKELMSYSSVANSGYFILAFAVGGSYATAGGLMHILNHALATAAIFMAFAAVVHRAGTTKVHELGGLILKMPLTFATYLVAIISLAGIPPTSGFVSKWLIYQQLVKNGVPFLAFAAFFGSIGSFMYVFKPLAGVFLGQLKPEHKNVKEAPILMLIPMMLLTLLTLFWGIFPSNAIGYINKISSYIGGDQIEVTFSRIVALTGEWDSLIVTGVFFIGFIIALLIFMAGKKSKQVDLMDNYTGGDFLYTAELYHFAHRMYRPFDRMFEKAPSMERWFGSLSNKLKELGALFKTLFYPQNPQGYVALVMLVVIGAFWWLR